MKRLVLTAVALGGIAVVAIGPGLVWTHVQGVRNAAKEAAEEALTDEQVIAQAEGELKQFGKTTREYALKVAGVGDQLAAARAKGEQVSKQLAGERATLARVKAALDAPDCRYEAGGRAFTRAEVEADGQTRLARCHALETALKSQTRLVAELTKAHDDGRKWLAEAEQARNTRAAELDALKVRLANARTRSELGTAGGAPAAPDPESAARLASLSERVKKLERGNDYDAATRTGGIDWTPPATGTRDAIAQYLSGAPAP
jgi:hypothetical protein